MSSLGRSDSTPLSAADRHSSRGIPAMKRDVHDNLEAQYTTYRIVRQLRDMPPHEVYEVYVEGQHAVYKGNTEPTGKAATDGCVTAFVSEQTSVPVPEILHVEDDYYIAAWHPDAPTPDVGRELNEMWADAAGRLLATLHDETAPLLDTYGHFIPAGEAISVAGSDDWHAAATDYIRRHRPILAQYGHADVADAVIEFLIDHPDILTGAGDSVCCHGWATPEHISVVDGQAVSIVDFEHAIAAPGEFDYWRTALPTFNHDTDGLQELFRAGYESVRALPTGFERRAPLYKVLNEVYYFESLYVQNQHGAEETEQRANWFRQRVCETLEMLS